ncbi:FAD-dependent monooxygenase [Arthrobacter sp. ERGS1:01]|uniref:FAD-dependent monooxygenase n=1 Tax=Arthrobacter sp. ERGS1:01 TaxID=1704044 RepID=UPI0006B4287B|nr:FAD-dependent monooxygenase [Arthrobacter sp. ERGS1:01]
MNRIPATARQNGVLGEMLGVTTAESGKIMDVDGVRNDAARVIIVGAGPVGLMLANELGRAGIPALVLERLAEPSPMPKGNGLVGEIVNVMAARGLSRGQKGLRAFPLPRYGFGPLRLKLNPLGKGALKVLPIPQRGLEELLERHAVAAGAQIRRGHEVTGFTDDGGKVRVDVAADGAAYSVEADYLVGCDGAHSLVRHHLGVDFPGITGEQLARIGRVTIPAGALVVGKNAVELPDGKRLVLFQPNITPTGSISLAPAAGLDKTAPKDLYVISTSEPRNGQEPAKHIDLAELQASIRRVLGAELPISDGQWLRATRSNSRLAERYRVGRVFLAGDAAHVFSAGGSALNTGMLDAVDLAARFAAVLADGAPRESLEDYHTARHEAGRRMLLATRAQAALLAPGENAEALREVLGAAFGTRSPSNYLKELLTGK